MVNYITLYLYYDSILTLNAKFIVLSNPIACHSANKRSSNHIFLTIVLIKS